ncbi:MAG TPA: recombinase family protein, partial [Patescibacteria group bacterium]|nr:recombinase family protein [Patescibacteria group bacterium]
VRIFKEEGRSAKNIIGRPVLIELLEYCRKNKKTIDAVIVYRLDRVSRQLQDYLSIRKKLADCDIAIISASEPTGNSPTEKFVESMLACFAQMDNDVKSERTKNGLKARFLAGLTSGTPPMGYKSENGYAVKDPNTWDKVKEAWELMATGTKTLREMATLMNKWGIKQRFHNKEMMIQPQTLSRIFRNKYYIGILTSSKYPEEVRGQHLPMVTEALFYRVQAVIDGRNTNINVPLARRNKDNSEFPLRRILLCDKCSKPVTGGWSKGKYARYAYYHCQNCRKAPSISAEKVHAEIVHYLSTITPTKEGLDAFLALLRRTYYQRVTQLQKRRDEADKELKRLYELRQSIIQKNLNGIYSDELFKEQNKIVESQIANIQITKDDALLAKYNLEAIVKFMKEKFASLGTTYQMSNLSQVRVLLCSIFPSGLRWNYPGLLNTSISPIYQSIRMFDADSVTSGAGGETRTLKAD